MRRNVNVCRDFDLLRKRGHEVGAGLQNGARDERPEKGVQLLQPNTESHVKREAERSGIKLNAPAMPAFGEADQSGR
jgi:hypothetical protein